MRQVREERESKVGRRAELAREVPYEILLFGRGARQSPHQQAGLWLTDRDGIEARPICEICGWAEPDWSPQGDSIVFAECDFNEPECEGGLYRLDLCASSFPMAVGWPGHEPVRLLGSEGRIASEEPPFRYLAHAQWDELASPRWSPAGDEVLLIVAGPELVEDGAVLERPFYAIVAMDPRAESADPVPVYHAFHTPIYEIAWSPDGRWIAALVGEPARGRGAQRLQIIDRASGIVLREWRLDDLGIPAGMHSGLDWATTAPVGHGEPLLAIGGVGVQTGKKRRSFMLYLVELSNGEGSSELVAAGRRPAFSPDGRQLLYEASPVRGAAFGAPCRMDLATGAVTELGGFWWVQRLAWRRPGRHGTLSIH